MLQTGRWNDKSCTELNTYICKMPKAHYPLPSVRPTVYGCPQVGQTTTLHLHYFFLTSCFDAHLRPVCQGWDAYGYACYWMEETGRTWSDAKAFCEEKDGFLLHIGDM